MRGHIQIAGIKDEEEAAMLVGAGVHQLGIPLKLTHHEEDCSEEDAATIVHAIRPPASAVVITYLAEADSILQLCNRIGVTSVQIHVDIPLAEIRKLKRLAPDMFVMKSLIVKDDNLRALISSMSTFSPYVDAFITDTHDPVSGACGATGKVHNWEISRALVEASSRPVFLAGGLDPENVRQAIFHVKPAGVDSHTGVEGPDGRKDKHRVQGFVREAMQAFAEVRAS
jgi:phosphoribosylanthranilate isomerase